MKLLASVKESFKRLYNLLDNISKSPIVSFFSESLVGLTSIRAYHDENKFIEVRKVFFSLKQNFIIEIPSFAE